MHVIVHVSPLISGVTHSSVVRSGPGELNHQRHPPPYCTYTCTCTCTVQGLHTSLSPSLRTSVPPSLPPSLSLQRTSQLCWVRRALLTTRRTTRELWSSTRRLSGQTQTAQVHVHVLHCMYMYTVRTCTNPNCPGNHTLHVQCTCCDFLSFFFFPFFFINSALCT